MHAADLPLKHGYTLGAVDHLAKAAVNMAGQYASDYLDRLDAAYGAIVVHLYEAPHWPTRYALLQAGATAVNRMVEADLRTRGYRRANGYSGAMSAPGFVTYWWGQSGPTPSPENAVVERIAIDQIRKRLTPTQMSAVAALALTGDHVAAAELLGVPPGTYATRLRQARITALSLWHEGETPVRQSIDRRVGRRGERPTHCPQGHEYTPDNVYLTQGRSSPRCKQCVKDAAAARRAGQASPSRELRPCGTYAAYWRHRRRGEPIDPACQAAADAYKEQLRLSRRKQVADA
ncbi:MAG TPA: hypothetical protein VFR67_06155 [Pilimelia sp.]|nr:hypothetical protein [Pilimelia sp.]